MSLNGFEFSFPRTINYFLQGYFFSDLNLVGAISTEIMYVGKGSQYFRETNCSVVGH